MNKKGQITIFVILGLILVASVFLVLQFLMSDEGFDFDYDDINQRIDYYLSLCIENVVDEMVPMAISQGGLLDDALFPSNFLNYNGELFITSFDRDGPVIILSSQFRNNFVNDIEDILNEEVPNCIFPLVLDANEEFEEEIDEFSFTLFSVNSYPEVFLAEYDFRLVIDGESHLHSRQYSFEADIFDILILADQFTDRFLLSYTDPDIYFNLEICEDMFLNRGFKPMYPVDFLNFYEEYNIEGFLLEQDFFIVRSSYNGLTFNYAIRPNLVEPIC